MGKAKTAAIDFDGVIHGYSAGWQDGTIYDDPVPGTAQALMKLSDMGYKIYIYSTRTNPIYHKGDNKEQKAAIEAYMEKHGLAYDRVWTFGKPMADVYIDDRAIPFRGDWDECIGEVENFRPWTKG